MQALSWGKAGMNDSPHRAAGSHPALGGPDRTPELGHRDCPHRTGAADVCCRQHMCCHSLIQMITAESCSAPGSYRCQEPNRRLELKTPQRCAPCTGAHSPRERQCQSQGAHINCDLSHRGRTVESESRRKGAWAGPAEEPSDLEEGMGLRRQKTSCCCEEGRELRRQSRPSVCTCRRNDDRKSGAVRLSTDSERKRGI